MLRERITILYCSTQPLLLKYNVHILKRGILFILFIIIFDSNDLCSFFK